MNTFHQVDVLYRFIGMTLVSPGSRFIYRSLGLPTSIYPSYGSASTQILHSGLSLDYIVSLESIYLLNLYIYEIAFFSYTIHHHIFIRFTLDSYHSYQCEIGSTLESGTLIFVTFSAILWLASQL